MMALLRFDLADLGRMREVERAAALAVLPFRSNTEAALVVFALVRCARTLLRLYPKATQAALLELVKAFLEGKETAPGVAEDALEGEFTLLQ